MKPILAFTAVTLLSTGAAFAQTEPTQPEHSQSGIFNALDADHNGTINSEEAQAAPVVSQSFASADKNHDGSLTQDEFNTSFTVGPPAAQPSSQAPANEAPAESPPPR